jgi:hypothetical protein
MLITLILLAMVAGLAAGLAASLAHLEHGPAARRARVHAGSHHHSSNRAKRPEMPRVYEGEVARPARWS